MRKLDVLAGALLIVGGLNWGLVAIARFDLVAWIFGEEFGGTNAASRIVYGLVGVAAIYAIAAVAGRRSSVRGRPAHGRRLRARPAHGRRPALVVTPHVTASNGVIHVINKVLIPASASGLSVARSGSPRRAT